MAEKQVLPINTAEDRRLRRPTIGSRIFVATVLLFVTVVLTFLHLDQENTTDLPWGLQNHASKQQCPQVHPLLPNYTSDGLEAMDQYLRGSKFREESIERLSHAVQISTESFDNMGEIGEDERWDVFYPFAAYLKSTFPQVHATLRLEKVNTHGLLFTWKGSDERLKPTLLMAHQDVVPVPKSTVHQWTYPPFSGHYDGKYIWGRGASDCKNQLIAILEAVEYLIKAGFEPKRTLILSFGFDEEISGTQGAGHLAPHLLSKHGKDSIAAIVDEGFGIYKTWGTNFALPAVAEKGYVDVDIIVRMPGGHSSIPPPHNGIGVMSELISEIEAHLYEPRLYNDNPYLGMLHCGAEHASDFPKELKKLLPKHSQCQAQDKLAHEAAKISAAVRYVMTTSVAVDVIEGGVKVNALPERVKATVNHRVNVGEKTIVVKKKLTELAGKVAQKYNLTLHAFNGNETPSSITLMAQSTQLEPAPVTPTNVDKVTPYAVLSGTTRALYGKDVYMAPGLTTGNTDTRYYWNLTQHIFRYGAGWDPEETDPIGNIHTVDEKVSVKAHVSSVQWFSWFIRNMDEADLD
jgi:Gly-Xaa carboxypeptidase